MHTTTTTRTAPHFVDQIETDAFRPRFKRGESVICTVLQPKTGDEIYALTDDGRQVFGDFVEQSGDTLTLADCNAKEPREFEVEIRTGKVWPVVGRCKLMGVA
ncbi:hypothetical protein CGK74_16880 [Thauera propionica]|uniref:Uncharacterized protein n=1 Tax=Thauera propionica TaxID=2019431 RepID=A0A235EUG3_9RHOO|nr:hypothetical protein [Thauera propionica]OYD52644.1 hypothetical protein CGK74_16880 [Thauera propionica]